MNGTYIVTYHHGKLYGEVNHFINSGIYIHDNEELYIYIYIYLLEAYIHWILYVELLMRFCKPPAYLHYM